MIFEDDVFYTLAPTTANKNIQFWHIWYNSSTNPVTLCGLIVLFVTILRDSYVKTLSNGFDQGGRDLYLILLTLLITFAIGYRIIQSLFLAKRDYSRLVFNFGDFLILLVVIAFTTGVAIVRFPDFPKAVLAVYAFLSAVGSLHFRRLETLRIPADERHYDIPIEVRIQKINAWVFGVIAADFALACLLMAVLNPINQFWVCLSLLPILPAVLFNIRHSAELTDWPKMLVNNRYLAPDKLAKRLEAIVGVDDEILSKRGVINALTVYKASYRSLNIRRAQKRDIKLLSDLYIRDFGYVLEEMFPNVGVSHQDLIQRLLRSSFGLGFLGFLRFYVLEINRKPVGMLMPEFRSEPTLYATLDYLSVGWLLIRRAGVGGLRLALRNLKALRALQPKPELNELRINYIAIVDDEMQKGIATRTITLLQQAFIHSSTNGFRAHSITAFVREGNTSSIALFEKAKFSCEEIDVDPAKDPTRGQGNALLRYIFIFDESAAPVLRTASVKRPAVLPGTVEITSNPIDELVPVGALVREPDVAPPSAKRARKKRISNDDAPPSIQSIEP